MTTCLVAGCVTRGEHKPDCPNRCHHHPSPCPKPRDGRPACDGTCTGCKPREADDGLAVCRWHRNRAEDAIALIPSLVAHLREIGKPYAQATPASDDTFSPGDPAERSALPAAWLAADEIEMNLAGWVHVTCEEVQPITWPNRPPWRGNIVRWALDHLDTMLRQDYAGDMVAELTGIIETTRHRWPTADDTQPVEKLAPPCPRCDTKALIRRAPRYAGDPRRIECTDPDCGAIYTEDEYDRLASIWLRDGRMGKWRTEERA